MVKVLVPGPNGKLNGLTIVGNIQWKNDTQPPPNRTHSLFDDF